MRHAKSSWDDPQLDDFDRPLNGRGRRSAIAVGEWLGDRGFEPDQVLSSDSLRTRETWCYVARAFEEPTEPEWLPSLYHASAQMILDVLRKSSKPSVMVLCHNPSTAQFAQMILAAAPMHLRFRDYPTAATLVADFDVDEWGDVEWNQGTPVDFTVPRDLGVE
jgi:phosphohistidine phosphatase